MKNNRYKKDHKRKKTAVWLVAAILAAIFLALAAVLLRAFLRGEIPVTMFVIQEVVYLGVMAGVVIAAGIRTREIKGGEEDDLSQY